MKAPWVVIAMSLAIVRPGAAAPPVSSSSGDAYPWPRQEAGGGALASRIPPPDGFQRLPAPAGTFGAWLRGMPAKPGRPEVLLFDGRKKANQDAHHLVLDVDVGKRDRQQCADAAIRLRAEYLFQSGRRDAICFRFTDGTPAWWRDFEAGRRPRVGTRTSWEAVATPDGSYASFRRYLDVVFNYAGTLSLARELAPAKPEDAQAGDVFIQGGSPGHAVIVVDVAQDPRGVRAVLLAQSYMPAQEIHVLRNPRSPSSPWYVLHGEGPLPTPEWSFPARSLRRFSDKGCPDVHK